jgi:hypothetical protein
VQVWFIYRPGDDLARQASLVRAAGEVAHAHGRRLVVHATELDVAKAGHGSAARANTGAMKGRLGPGAMETEGIAFSRCTAAPRGGAAPGGGLE